ncbi:hypothetical protein A2635_02595 [Candidatus Peribacteria bacterium RIFCSPHIGHO2_01_FULL_51_9]|nr:MAG: hypothetical protein A2635_02595 [Candidatus Peribacteria bacterium RIFCSPHIGHO2_01_FULL_51_9]
MPNENPMIAYADALHTWKDDRCKVVQDLRDAYMNDGRRDRELLRRRFDILCAIQLLTMAFRDDVNH